MLNVRQRSLGSLWSAVLGGTIISVSCLAHAEDSAPHAPQSMPTETPEAAGEAGATAAPQFAEQPASASTNEPTLETETERMAWPNRPLLATGATLFGLSYLPAVIGGALSDAEDKEDLYIPVAGPWMMLTQGADESRGEKALLVTNGVAQGVGALMLLSSFFIPERRTEHWYLLGSNDLRLTPARVGTGYGMGALGRF
jgi:hypothetical protein